MTHPITSHQYRELLTKAPEKNVHLQVCEWLKYQYPNVLFHTDFGAGCKLTIGQAVAQKKLQKIKGFPDLYIIEARHGHAGLFLELKKEGTRLTKKNGSPASEHVAEQIKAQMMLMERGFYCSFAIGFEEAKQIIEKYLKP